ncbi:hypothetical protein B0G73_1362 [Paraburkholderia sp. BL25I1N1]|nr:hypothetical protein B0G73_1362 [Paraburkholderia sp. BL25I1N1]
MFIEPVLSASFGLWPNHPHRRSNGGFTPDRGPGKRSVRFSLKTMRDVWHRESRIALASEPAPDVQSSGFGVA